ncbi:hypothetical protein AVEN_143039-1 [Araneus ventricosus]|uniref:BTB domain-containing protein n=1 Tax=Araneus ventricosus TaxID=182803 RepID=A0A4Y2KS60_ARAVE|nr:hypothetical protein AVEN_143039-1 [Araneus ventricosus]
MDKKKDSMFIRRGKKHELTWIMRIATLSDLFSECSSPRFETTEKVHWKISLWTGLFTGEDYLFCTLLRLLDGGPSEVHYSVNCKVFIGPERPEDIRCKRQRSKDKAFREGSAFDFRLLSVPDIRRKIGAYLSTAPVKLILQICLQRKSFESLRSKSLFVSTELELGSSSENYYCENRLYIGKKKECVLEEKDESDNTPRDMRTTNYVSIGCLDSGANTWYPIVFHLNEPNSLFRCQMHFLDVNYDIYASSEARKYESGAQRVGHRIHIMKKEDVQKKREILSRHGEIHLRCELSGDRDECYVSQKWTFFPRRIQSTLREDLKDLSQSCSKGTNLKIRIDGEVLNVYKEIICARSPVFHRMFSTNMIEKLSNVIDIEGMRLETLNNFLDYLYSGKFENCMEWEDACDLYSVAEKYFVPSLRRVCSRKLALCVSLENCEQLKVHSRLFEDKELRFSVTSFKLLNANNSICSAGCEHLNDATEE